MGKPSTTAPLPAISGTASSSRFRRVRLVDVYGTMALTRAGVTATSPYSEIGDKAWH